MESKNLKIILILASSLILGISVEYLFFDEAIGISLFVFNLILISLSFFLNKKFGEAQSRERISINC